MTNPIDQFLTIVTTADRSSGAPSVLADPAKLVEMRNAYKGDVTADSVGTLAAWHAGNPSATAAEVIEAHKAIVAAMKPKGGATVRKFDLY